MKSFNQHTEHELDREQLDEELNKKVKIDEATAGDFLLGLGVAGGLLALKKGWDKFGKGSKLARGLAFTKKGKAKVDQDKLDKAKEKQDQKTTKADADALKYEKDDEGNIKKQADAQAYKDKTDKAPPGWVSSKGKPGSPADGAVWSKDAYDKWMEKRKADTEKKLSARAAKKSDSKKDDETASYMHVAKNELSEFEEKDRNEILENLVLEETMTLEESNELQAIMALDDVGISAEINRKGEVVVKKKDLKKAQKALKKSFKKGGEPDLKVEEVVVIQPNELADLNTYLEMKMSAAAKKKKALWAKSSKGKASLKKSKIRSKKVASGSIKIDKAKGRAMAKARAKGGIRNEFELDEALKPLDKSVIDAFYYKKEKAGKVVSTDGDTLWKDGMGGQTIAQWLNPSGKIAISAVTDVKSTESILKYMKKSIPKGNFDKRSYKKFFGEELQRTAYDIVSEARNRAIKNKPEWETENSRLS